MISLKFVGFYGLNWATFVCSFLSAILFAIDLFTGIEEVKGAPLTVCTMFGLGGLVISCVCGIFMFNEPMSWFQAAGLLLFLIGAYLLTAKDKNKTSKIDLRTYLMLLINLLVNGLVMILQKYFSVKVSNGNVSLFSFLTFLLNSLIMFVFVAFYGIKNRSREEKNEKKKEKTFFGLPKRLLLCGALLAFALFVINLLVTQMGKTVDSVILFPVSSALSLGLVALVGWAAFQEKLALKNWIGLLIGLLGIVIIGILTPETVSKLF